MPNHKWGDPLPSTPVIVGPPVGPSEDACLRSYANGVSRDLTCGRCDKPTGNSTQGHHWTWCKVTHSMRSPHFCCPGDCELEVARVGTSSAPAPSRDEVLRVAEAASRDAMLRALPSAPTPAYAIIHVRSGHDGHAWPIVERVPGGWQSGAHHYPDAEVLDVTPLVLMRPERLVAVGGWICEDTGVHDCDGGGAEASGAHEPGCGLARLFEVSEFPAPAGALSLPAPAPSRDEVLRAVGAALDDATDRSLPKSTRDWLLTQHPRYAAAVVDALHQVGMLAYEPSCVDRCAHCGECLACVGGSPCESEASGGVHAWDSGAPFEPGRGTEDGAK